MRLSLNNAKLYLILDTQVNDYDQLFAILKQAVAAGVDVVQLRDNCGKTRDSTKFAEKALEYLKRRIPLIINDRLDVAMACEADGVHLGQEDLPIEYARKLAGRKMIIGISCQTKEHVLKAKKFGADYIGLGSVFKTQTKPDRSPMDLNWLSQAIQLTNIPVFAIGGINLANIGKILPFGVKRVAVTRAICFSSDIKKTVQEFRKFLDA